MSTHSREINFVLPAVFDENFMRSSIHYPEEICTFVA